MGVNAFLFPAPSVPGEHLQLPRPKSVSISMRPFAVEVNENCAANYVCVHVLTVRSFCSARENRILINGPSVRRMRPDSSHCNSSAAHFAGLHLIRF